MNEAAQPAPDAEQPDSQVTTHYSTFDWDDYEPISSTVTSTVARAAGVPESDLQELYDCIEPCALNQLFQSMHNSSQPTSGQFTFEYAGFEVTIYSFGEVVVRPPGTRRP